MALSVIRLSGESIGSFPELGDSDFDILLEHRSNTNGVEIYLGGEEDLEKVIENDLSPAWADFIRKEIAVYGEFWAIFYR